MCFEVVGRLTGMMAAAVLVVGAAATARAQDPCAGVSTTRQVLDEDGDGCIDDELQAAQRCPATRL
jgi:hypothetical protein